MKKTIPFLFVAALLAVVSTQAQNVIGRFNYDSLRAPNVLCTYGTYSIFNNYRVGYGPYVNVGIIDHGPTAYGFGGTPGSRHTVHTDVLQKDSISGNSLYCIPSGKTSSVRLGCHTGAAICQAISYTFRVDTSLNNLLTVNYAPVVYNPGHPADQQPRLRVEILDSIDTLLGYMDIVSLMPSSSGSLSNLTLPWQNGISGGYYFIDWAPLSISMHSYHGMEVKLRITTFACGQGASNHCGYAYYTVDYKNMTLTPQPMLAKSNSIGFVAPQGFMSYEWRLDSAPANVFSTDDSATIPLGEAFSCVVTDYFGNSTTLRSVSAPRRPQADFAHTFSSDPNSSGYILRLTNLAKLIDTVTNTPLPDLEDFHWIIDDTSLCYQRNPEFAMSEGWHIVSLVVRTNTTGLSDTMTRQICLSDDNLSIGSAEGERLHIYPNPAHDRINVEGGIVDKVVATDNGGRVFAVPAHGTVIDISGLKNGIYTMKITASDGSTAVRRIVKK